MRTHSSLKAFEKRAEDIYDDIELLQIYIDDYYLDNLDKNKHKKHKARDLFLEYLYGIDSDIQNIIEDFYYEPDNQL